MLSVLFYAKKTKCEVSVMNRVFLVVMLAALLLVPALIEAKDYQLISDPSVPAATGKVTVDKDRNGNYKMKVEVRHLAKPEELTPPRQGYVVWVQGREGEPVNAGHLRVNKNLDGELATTTPSQQFDIFITAEDTVAAQSPSGPRLLHATVAP
jgi:hypothetical protein